MIKKILLSILKNIKIISLAILLKKLYALMLDLAEKLFFTEKKDKVNKFIEAILEDYDYCKRIVKNHFNKNLRKRFQLSNTCWIRYKFFNAV